jgi:hypothetical protein
MGRHAAKYQWALVPLLLLPGCENDPTPGPGNPSTPTLSGFVINPANQSPVAGAVVSFGEAVVTTGANGRYVLDGLTPGTDTLRCTLQGYYQLALEVTVGPGTVFRDISLGRIEVFELGDFALYVPGGVDEVRGILLALGGPNTKAFANGEPFGAPVPEVEASLQTLGVLLRDMAADRGMAILGSSVAGMADGPESDQLIQDALLAAEAASARPGLATLPVLLYGMSAGAPQVSGFSIRHPERVAGLLFKVPVSVPTVTSGHALGIPTFMVLAEQDAFVDNAVLTATYEANRGAGALWGMAMEAAVPHHSLSLSQRLLTLGWINQVLETRLPANPSEPLRDLTESDGWLGDPATGAVASWASYPGDRAVASWLPSEVAAQGWQDFMSLQLPPGVGPFPDVSGIYDLSGVVTDAHGWGMEGWTQTAALSIHHSTDQPRFVGTFESIIWNDPNGGPEATRPGAVSGTVDGHGRIHFELLIEGNQVPSTFDGSVASGRIEGTFRAGELSGTFEAERRGD